ncbi:MAG: hypothetical protein Q4P72_04435, partial [Eubacteriales bacterium]|nr:hypothetical protein [Eubacteriales bacterium]
MKSFRFKNQLIAMVVACATLGYLSACKLNNNPDAIPKNPDPDIVMPETSTTTLESSSTTTTTTTKATTTAKPRIFGKVTAGPLNLRSGASADSNILTQID